MPTHDPKVLVDAVSVTFESRGRSVVALDRISLQARAGEFLCIVGPSGSGKSTLLRVLAGLHRQSAGEVRITADRPGTPLTAMVFQEHALLPWRTVRDNVAFGLENRGVGRAERDARAREMLALVGLARFAQHYPHQLSGGMKQRVGMARALANDPEVLLMDEPLAALDAQTRTIMQEELLRIWATLGKTVVYVTHSLEEALLLGDRVVLLTARPGRVSEVYPVDLGRRAGSKCAARPRTARCSKKSGRGCAKRSCARWRTIAARIRRRSAREGDGALARRALDRRRVADRAPRPVGVGERDRPLARGFLPAPPRRSRRTSALSRSTARCGVTRRSRSHASAPRSRWPRVLGVAIGLAMGPLARAPRRSRSGLRRRLSDSERALPSARELRGPGGRDRAGRDLCR
jgi:NitT/TauT family transport system ATP-binding protein